jgi:hypothetical protein
LFPGPHVLDPLSNGAPRPPGNEKEKSREAEPSSSPAGQDDGLEGVDEASEKASQPCEKCHYTQ